MMSVTRCLIVMLLIPGIISPLRAAPVERHFDVEVTIPSSEFYVVTDSGWEAYPQEMFWQESRLALSRIERHLKMKNVRGGINVYMPEEPELLSPSSAVSVPLHVTIAGKAISAGQENARRVLNAHQAATEKIVPLIISQKAPFPDRPPSGLYQGAVTLIFDSVIDQLQ